MHQLAVLLGLDRLTHVVDVGANPMEGDPPYQKMLDAGLCRVTGFDPQMTGGRMGLTTVLPYAIGDGAQHELRECAYPGWTSLFEPSVAALACFPFFRRNATVTHRTQVQTRRLDDLDLGAVDFLKVDAQGSELAVLQNGRDTLEGAVAVQVEVQFVDLYEGQPSLGQVDMELRGQGFVPHTFAALKKWPIAPLRFGDDQTRLFNQLLEADMVYVRDFVRLDAVQGDQLRQLGLISHVCYGSFDLAGRCVALLEKRGDIPVGALDYYAALLKGAS